MSAAAVIEREHLERGDTGMAAWLTSQRQPVPLSQGVAELVAAGRSQRAPGTVARYESDGKNIVAFFGADRPIASLTKQDAQRYVDARLGLGRKANTVSRELATLQAIVSLQVDYGRAPSRLRVPRLRMVKRVPRVLSDAEIGAFFRCAEAYPRFRQMCLVALATGARFRSELYPLRKADVDLRAETITLGANRPTKTNKPRTVPLTSQAVEALKSAIDAAPFGELVWPGEGGNLRNDDRFALNAICVEANVKRFTLHVFRHTWATRLWAQFRDLRLIMDLGGWSNLKSVLVYTQVTDAAREAVRAFSLPVPSLEGHTARPTKRKSRGEVFAIEGHRRKIHD